VSDDVRAWKEELVRVADRLEAKTKQKRWTDKGEFLIERDFMVAAYAIRKVLQSHTVSNEIRQGQIPVRRFESSAQRPIAPGDISVSYDFDHGRRRMLPLADLCQEMLDNSVFSFCCGETTDFFDGVYVSSDRRDEYVYLVLASDFIALCLDMGA
jgi:hypothetical protein